MASQTQSQNPFPRNRSRLIPLFGWLAVLHGSALVLIVAFAITLGVL